jgi:hypothetical protein
MKGALRATGHRRFSGPADPKTAMAGGEPGHREVAARSEPRSDAKSCPEPR